MLVASLSVHANLRLLAAQACSSLGVSGTEEEPLALSSIIEKIEAFNDRLYTKFNNGVYRSGFSESDEAYLKN